MSRCRPNARDASLMLIPSTITARRTRRYTSTLYIHRTTHRLNFQPMDGGGGYVLQPPNVSDYPPTWNTLTPPITESLDNNKSTVNRTVPVRGTLTLSEAGSRWQ